MASPMIASAAGLYLQRYPGATDTNAWRCLIQTAYTDYYTGFPHSPLPNAFWGYGKLDAFNALTQCSNNGAGLPVVAFLKTSGLSAYPNPFAVNTEINYDFSDLNNFNKASIVVYDIMGKAVKTIDLNSSSGTITMNRAGLASEFIFYLDGRRISFKNRETGSFVILLIHKKVSILFVSLLKEVIK